MESVLIQPESPAAVAIDPHQASPWLVTLISLMKDPEIAKGYVEEQVDKLHPIPTTYLDIALRVAAAILHTKQQNECTEDLLTYLSNSSSSKQTLKRYQTVLLALDSLCTEREYKIEGIELLDVVRSQFNATMLLVESNPSPDEEPPAFDTFRVELITHGLEAMGA